MEATAVSLARSVLDGVLNRAGSAVADEAALLLGVRREVEFIRDELDMMRSFLKVATTNPDADDRVRTWVKQVRDLAYDVEDCLLDFALYADNSSSSRRAGACAWLPGTIATRHRIAARIRELKASVEELNQRFLRYQIVVDQPRGGAVDQQQQGVLPDHDAYSAELAFKESDIIIRRKEKAELTKELISGSDGPPGVVSVWGMGGMGKSSLVRMVHNDPVFLDAFDCSAWVTVPHPLDSTDEFIRRLGKNFGVSPELQKIREHLQEKRFVVIVDDLNSKEEWGEYIWPVLQQVINKGSRIIVTTRREDVATYCTGHIPEVHSHVHELKSLGPLEAMGLFCRKVYKSSEYRLEEEMKDQADHILHRCRGLPLAISTIGGLLANRPKTSIEWRNLHEHLGAELESDLRNITTVIVSSYDGLPYHLKSIFLYLSIFPENHEIRCNRLLRRWMAEGYITKNRDMPVEEVGERFYNELINRSMIQPCKKISPSVRVARCRVHSMVLHIILAKFIEENQLFMIKKHCNEVPQSKVRHLVVSSWKKRDNKVGCINFSYIRSLTVFGECPSSLISPKMRLLRVLDLEDTLNLKNEDLRHIGQLYHLRYLCLRGTEISKLPPLQNLRYLETLDIQDTHLTQLPDGIAKLEKLRYLLTGVNFSKDLLYKMAEANTGSQKANLLGNMAAYLCCNNSDYCKISGLDRFSVRAPEGLEKLRDLHMLGVINVGQGNGVVRKFKKLTNLRSLGVTGVTEEGQELCKSIAKLSRLQRLEVRADSLEFLIELNELVPPKHLVSLRLYGKLPKLPEWIFLLNGLAKLKLLGTQLEQGEIMRLEKLHNLALLGLWGNSYVGNSLHFGGGMFPKLKFLDIDGLENIKIVHIEKEAMPELEQLWVNNCKSLQDSDNGLSGIPHLPKLNELVLKNCGEKEKLMERLQKQVIEHPKRPKFFIGKSIPAPHPNEEKAQRLTSGDGSL